MREITMHHDGHGLNDILVIKADERDAEKGGNASHYYNVGIHDKETNQVRQAADIQFQHGPRDVEGSAPGITEAVLFAILIDRLEGFQAGPYACDENEQQLHYLRAAMTCTRERANARANQGVLGQNETHVTFVKMKSTHIAEIGHDPLERQLHVKFTDGGYYVYDGVDKGVFDSWKMSESSGVFFQNYVKGRYKFEKQEAT